MWHLDIKAAQLKWYSNRTNWDREWNHLVFSDGSWFCFWVCDDCRRVKWLCGKFRRLEFLYCPYTKNHGMGSDNYSNRLPLVFINKNLNPNNYTQIELQSLRYSCGLITPVFQQDNACPYITRVTITCLHAPKNTLFVVP